MQPGSATCVIGTSESSFIRREPASVNAKTEQDRGYNFVTTVTPAGTVHLILQVTHIHNQTGPKQDSPVFHIVNFVNDTVKGLFHGYFHAAIMITAVIQEEHRAKCLWRTR